MVFQYTILGVPAPSTISGDNDFCITSNPYTIPNLPAGAAVTWNATPAGVVTINTPNSPQTTVTKNNNGVITLTAVISNVCGGQISIPKPSITVGIASQPGTINFSLIDPTFGKLFADIEPVVGATSYNWYKNGVLNTLYHGASAHFSISKTQCDIEYDISVEAINSCGSSAQSHANAYVPCDNYYMVSPNPASGDVSVTADQTKSVKGTNATFDEVSIYDLQGNLKKYQKFNKIKTTSINVSSLVNGNYYIEISNGAYKERKQLLIQK